MRWIVLAMMLAPAFALAATADLGTTREPRNNNLDDCADMNFHHGAGSCVQLPPGAVGEVSPMVLYLTTGRADGRVELWQEENDWTGLQRGAFYADTLVEADITLL